MIKAIYCKFDMHVLVLTLTYKVTKIRLNYYSVKIHLAGICTLTSAF